VDLKKSPLSSGLFFDQQVADFGQRFVQVFRCCGDNFQLSNQVIQVGMAISELLVATAFCCVVTCNRNQLHNCRLLKGDADFQ